MGRGGCYSFMKYIVFLINLIFWLSGIALIVFAVWLLTDPTFYISMPKEQLSYSVSAYLLLGLGVLLFLAGFFGCCGIIMKSPLLLVLFFCVMLLVLVAEISAGIWGFSYKNELNELIHISVKDTVLYEYGVDEQKTNAFDSIQKELHCCGADGPEDWLSNNSRNLTFFMSTPELEYQLPSSCCNTADPAELNCLDAIKRRPTAPLSEYIYKDGCTKMLLAELSTYKTWLIVVLLILVLAQIIGLIFSVSLCYSLKREQRYKA